MALYPINTLNEKEKIKEFLGDMFKDEEEYYINFIEPRSGKDYDEWQEKFNEFEKGLDGSYTFDSKTFDKSARIYLYLLY